MRDKQTELIQLDDLEWLLRYGDEKEIIEKRFVIAQKINTLAYNVENKRGTVYDFSGR